MSVVCHCIIAVLVFSAVVCGQEQPASGPVPEQPQAVESNPLLYVDALLSNVYKNDSPFLCELCEDVIGFLRNVTENKEVLHGIVEIAKVLCKLVPNFVYKECIDYAELLPEIIKAFADEYLNPQTDCAAVCTTKNPQTMPDSNIIPNVMAMLKAKKNPIN